MTELIVLGSECAVSDQYMELIIEAAEESGLEYTIRKIENAEEIEKWGVQQGCLLGYCPGCHSIATESPDIKFTPALVVNGELKTHGGYHGKEEIMKTWTNT
ncbi:MAG: hypothetical protein PQJ61_03055 [Spirochaetales bacterium]|uniref:Thioredoxin-like fold domain-containing protein n=1 Tax=Candidatus Thalassospirochaeta sargassi TaxID=3119039 RepID=A0AAJ1IGD1_9SPIO|nr:hypothetical protein [Spirochaetales bacterium]